MLLSDIFEHLTYGELAQLPIGGIENGVIADTHYPAVVSYVNLALNAIFKRFPLIIKSIDLQERSDVDIYYLRAERGITAGTASELYLLDSATDLFINKVLKIERVTSDDEEEIGNLPLNDVNNEESLFTQSFDSIRLFEPNDTTILTVYYRAGHTKIDPVGLDPTTTEIDMPTTLVEPLIYHIASRAHANTPVLDGQANRSMEYMQKYELACKEIETRSLVENTSTTNTKLDDNGWV